MSDILAIIKSKKTEDVTLKELDVLRLAIEGALQTINELQTVHRIITGRDHRPSIKL